MYVVLEPEGRTVLTRFQQKDSGSGIAEEK